jgi:hypothetical protein
VIANGVEDLPSFSLFDSFSGCDSIYATKALKKSHDFRHEESESGSGTVQQVLARAERPYPGGASTRRPVG